MLPGKISCSAGATVVSTTSSSHTRRKADSTAKLNTGQVHGRQRHSWTNFDGDVVSSEEARKGLLAIVAIHAQLVERKILVQPSSIVQPCNSFMSLAAMCITPDTLKLPTHPNYQTKSTVLAFEPYDLCIMCCVRERTGIHRPR